MIKKILAASILLSSLCLTSHADAKVKIYLDETKKEYINADKLDCDVYEGSAGITIGFKAGNMLFSVGPEITLGKENSINWDKLVQGIIARYKELCTRFNSGAITMKAYNERLKEIDAIAKEALEFQQKMIKRVKDESKDAFKELDATVKKEEPATSDNISKGLENISLKIKTLPAIEGE
ncbi:MAG: hypothetical protein HZB61_02390 [Nitrospirae bacterium]|nr:hypothetical protein [Nitrospirota bacterium]